MLSPVILVPGANRGIGFAIVQSTALRDPNGTYILACRSQSAGSTAIQELQKLGVTAPLDIVVLDVTEDASILAAKEVVEKKYGKLDSKLRFLTKQKKSRADERVVLVNNAGIAVVQKDPNDLSDLRNSFNATFNANVSSVAAVTNVFLPLLHLSSYPRAIHISSGRASLQRSTQANFPQQP